MIPPHISVRGEQHVGPSGLREPRREVQRINCLVLLLAGANLVAVVTTSQEVRSVADIYLPWAAFTALSGVLAFQMDGVFIGATWSRDSGYRSLVSE